VARPFRAGIDCGLRGRSRATRACQWCPAGAALTRAADETLLAIQRSHFAGAGSRPETKIGYQQPLIKQWGSVMWDIIINLFYHQARKRYVAAARRPWALWA